MDIYTVVTILLFLPAAVCFFNILSFWALEKNSTQNMLLRVLCTALFYFITFGVYLTPSTNYRWLVILDMINEPLILCLQIMVMSYIYSHYKGKPIARSVLHLLLIIPVIHATALWLIYYIIGIDNLIAFNQIYDQIFVTSPTQPIFELLPPEYQKTQYVLYFFFDTVMISVFDALFDIAILTLAVLSLKAHHYKFGNFFRFWFKGHETNPHSAASFLVIVLIVALMPLVIWQSVVIMNLPILSAVMSIVISMGLYLLCHIEIHSGLPLFTFKSLTNINLQYEKVYVNEAAHIRQEKKADLTISLRQLIEEENIYLDRELSIDTVAERLGTNRNKVSVLVQQIYHLTFRDLINNLRIEAAQSYMVSNPDATNDAVAWECGFADPSTFFRRFKDATGITPRQWLAKQPAQSKEDDA